MSYAVLDTESTIHEKGHPFSARNKLCLVGLRVGTTNHIYPIEYNDSPYDNNLAKISDLVRSVSCVVGFNLKHDLNWLARYGVRLPHYVSVFDCQLAEFILSHQTTPFPSLDGCGAKYGLGNKLDVVEREYWSLGIDTPQVPKEILYPYLEQDLELTDALYRKICDGLQHSRPLVDMETLISLHMQDLRVLQEMEFNGIQLNWASMEQEARKVGAELDGINRAIKEYVPEIYRHDFNTGSNDHVSLLLYGGTLNTKQATPYTHEYKSGPKAGTSETRNKWKDLSIQFPRLVEPLEGTSLAKDGFWSTGADVLRELTGAKELIKLLLKQAGLSKLLDTYYCGLPKVAGKMAWEDGLIHSQLNQCVAITGRLSSSRPNQQNFPPEMEELIVSRY